MPSVCSLLLQRKPQGNGEERRKRKTRSEEVKKKKEGREASEDKSEPNNWAKAEATAGKNGKKTEKGEEGTVTED